MHFLHIQSNNIYYHSGIYNACIFNIDILQRNNKHMDISSHFKFEDLIQMQ